MEAGSRRPFLYLVVAAEASAVVGLVALYANEPSLPMFSFFFLVVVDGALVDGFPGAAIAAAITVIGYSLVAAAVGPDIIGPSALLVRLVSMLLVGAVIGTLVSQLRALEGRHKKTVKDLQHALANEAHVAEDLRQVDEMKNSFMEGVAHDLRNPMSVVLGLSNVLANKRSRLTEEQVEKSLVSIADAAKEAEHSLSDLLEVSKGLSASARIQRVPVDVAAAVRDVVARVPDLHDREVRLELAEGEVMLDAHGLERLLQNLLWAEAIRAPKGPLTVSTEMKSDGLYISVCDEGAAVPVEDLANVFDPYVRNRSLALAEGVGLRLFLAAQFAIRQGGNAWAEPREGGGSTFCVKLPTS